MKLAAAAITAVLAVSSASACMVVTATYDIYRQQVLSGALYDNNQRHCNLSLNKLSLNDEATADIRCYTNGWNAKIHHDGDMNFAIEVTPAGRETLRFTMEKECEERAEIMQYEPSIGEVICEHIKLRIYQYGCTEDDLKALKNSGVSL